MNKTFYNTTNEVGAQLEAFTETAACQEQLIITFARKVKFFSPSHLHRYLLERKQISENTPLTSIRRAITNLTEANRLVKTTNKVTSVYNKPEYVWQYNSNNG
jgi:hypothetical protein